MLSTDLLIRNQQVLVLRRRFLDSSALPLGMLPKPTSMGDVNVCSADAQRLIERARAMGVPFGGGAENNPD